MFTKEMWWGKHEYMSKIYLLLFLTLCYFCDNWKFVKYPPISVFSTVSTALAILDMKCWIYRVALYRAVSLCLICSSTIRIKRNLHCILKTIWFCVITPYWNMQIALHVKSIKGKTSVFIFKFFSIGPS